MTSHVSIPLYTSLLPKDFSNRPSKKCQQCQISPHATFLHLPTKSPALILTPTLPPGGPFLHFWHSHSPLQPTQSSPCLLHCKNFPLKSDHLDFAPTPVLPGPGPLFSHYAQRFLWPLLTLPDQAPRGGSCHSAPISVCCASPHSLLLRSSPPIYSLFPATIYLLPQSQTPGRVGDHIPILQ